MDRQRAIEVLEQHNAYRRDKNVPSIYQMGKPKEIGEAIDYAIEVLKISEMINEFSKKVWYYK